MKGYNRFKLLNSTPMKEMLYILLILQHHGISIFYMFALRFLNPFLSNLNRKK